MTKQKIRLIAEPKHKEEGNIIDQLGAIIVMLFVFSMILAYAAYGKTVQQKLTIDNIAKEYLYEMEQTGYLKNKDALTTALIDNGITVTDDYAGTTTTQVAYGDKVILSFQCEFPNPLFTTFANDSKLFHGTGLSEMNTYTVYMTATSKW